MTICETKWIPVAGRSAFFKAVYTPIYVRDEVDIAYSYVSIIPEELVDNNARAVVDIKRRIALDYLKDISAPYMPADPLSKHERNRYNDKFRRQFEHSGMIYYANTRNEMD